MTPIPNENGRRQERETNAEEVAETFMALFADVDVAEEILSIALKRRKAHSRQFWSEVVTYLAQVRGNLEACVHMMPQRRLHR